MAAAVVDAVSIREAVERGLAARCCPLGVEKLGMAAVDPRVDVKDDNAVATVRWNGHLAVKLGSALVHAVNPHGAGGHGQRDVSGWHGSLRGGHRHAHLQNGHVVSEGGNEVRQLVLVVDPQHDAVVHLASHDIAAGWTVVRSRVGPVGAPLLAPQAHFLSPGTVRSRHEHLAADLGLVLCGAERGHREPLLVQAVLVGIRFAIAEDQRVVAESERCALGGHGRLHARAARRMERPPRAPGPRGERRDGQGRRQRKHARDCRASDAPARAE
mmetsp:Transcript_8771/g.35838  ORF Transcript_8771/g.35838 Transcript_8771/m.35838 type:complete len:271 (-) Transcript_8771:431-1243(-)